MSTELPELERLLSDAAQRRYGRRARSRRRVRGWLVPAAVLALLCVAAVIVARQPSGSDERTVGPRRAPRAETLGEAYGVFAKPQSRSHPRLQLGIEPEHFLDTDEPVLTRVLRGTAPTALSRSRERLSSPESGSSVSSRFTVAKAEPRAQTRRCCSAALGRSWAAPASRVFPPCTPWSATTSLPSGSPPRTARRDRSRSRTTSPAQRLAIRSACSGGPTATARPAPSRSPTQRTPTAARQVRRRGGVSSVVVAEGDLCDRRGRI
jgi:hypothetical protein